MYSYSCCYQDRNRLIAFILNNETLMRPENKYQMVFETWVRCTAALRIPDSNSGWCAALAVRWNVYIIVRLSYHIFIVICSHVGYHQLPIQVTATAAINPSIRLLSPMSVSPSLVISKIACGIYLWRFW